MAISEKMSRRDRIDHMGVSFFSLRPLKSRHLGC